MFNAPVRTWFAASFTEPTAAQALGLPLIASGSSTLIFAPTGSGKTLAAFLVAIDRIMFSPEPPLADRCRVVYVSPLKALATDVEKNLRVPIAGIAEAATRAGASFRLPVVSVRSGDTKASERARMRREPPDILITTPESLYLLLTSQSRAMFGSTEAVIVDEIHSLVPTKRGAHLFLSLERLASERPRSAPALQRIGLSATQRPLDEVARLLGGADSGTGQDLRPRPVAIVDAGSKKAWDLRIEVPVDDMANIDLRDGRGEEASAETPGALAPRSIWPAIHPRLVELIRSHRSTMIFANSRRGAERLSAAINDLAGEELSLAHHGSVARDKRRIIEERLKLGELKAIVATSSLELGIDIGAVDLVVQVEAPPSVASGLQRIGRAGHSVGAVSRGIIFPKFRGDLLAAAATTERMMMGLVEEMFFLRNPLDVLAQQIVAIVNTSETTAHALYALVRQAAPFADLPWGAFEGVLDMLSGRYPSAEFSELRPRITWDRKSGRLRGREGSKRLAILNGGTIPDRGLYGVFIEGSDGADDPDRATKARSLRVGELDEEMVFETKVGEVFLLGASSWRVTDITRDRVLVAPAPGEPGKTPFWHGDRLGRPVELGRAVGALARILASENGDAAMKRLRAIHSLDDRAARNLIEYVRAQVAATGEVPSDRTIVIERYKDEVGDYRVCILSPFGSRVHAPLCTAVLGRLHEESDQDIEGVASDDGIFFRFPGTDEPPPVDSFLPPADEIEERVVGSLGGSALFAARFRENAGRALLLPRRFPGQRTPLWATRKKSADLLAVASRFPAFPLILETYRECLRDVFDMPGLIALLRQIEARTLRVFVVDTQRPSPFASALLFSYAGNFIYDLDAPLAERRARALTVDPVELRALLGEANLRDLLDPEAIRELTRSLQRLDGHRPVAHADAIHDLLLSLGDLSLDEVAARSSEPAAHVRTLIESLVDEGRVLSVRVAGDHRFVAVEDASRVRDALGVALPEGLPTALTASVADPLGDLLSRYARTHGPFRIEEAAARFGLGIAPVRAALEQLTRKGRVVEGEFSPSGTAREHCDAEVLRTIKRRSLAKLRKAVEPVSQAALGRFLVHWQGIDRRRRGADAILSVVEQLQGAPIPASVLETDVLPARIVNYLPGDLDTLTATGEVTWIGLERLGPRDGRVAVVPTSAIPLLAPPPRPVEGALVERVRAVFDRRGAIFFSDLVTEVGGFPQDVLAALWDLVWAGAVTNDTLAPLRSLLRGGDSPPRERPRSMRRSGLDGRAFRRAGPPGSEGRWSLIPRPREPAPSEAERRTALARSLLDRHGVLTREAVAAEGIVGGFSAVYEVLKAMEEAGRVRRGYFIEGLGATQFALPGADDHLRSLREAPERSRARILAATDPANPYGAALDWPARKGSEGPRPQRIAGAFVVLLDGTLLGHMGRTEKHLLTFLPEGDPGRGRAEIALATALGALVDEGHRSSLLIARLDGEDALRSTFGARLLAAGFVETSKGYFRRHARRTEPTI